MIDSEDITIEFKFIILFSLLLTLFNIVVCNLYGLNLVIMVLFIINLEKIVKWYEKKKKR